MCVLVNRVKIQTQSKHLPSDNTHTLPSPLPPLPSPLKCSTTLPAKHSCCAHCLSLSPYTARCLQMTATDADDDDVTATPALHDDSCAADSPALPPVYPLQDYLLESQAKNSRKIGYVAGKGWQDTHPHAPLLPTIDSSHCFRHISTALSLSCSLPRLRLRRL